jgi:hypothetical protein
LPGEQTALLWQSLHVPLLQTWLVPHAEPFGTFAVFVQAVVPVAHDVVPD